MSNTSSNNGSGSSKKENSLAATIGANAGDFALNFFDKLKKKNSTTNLMQNTNAANNNSNNSPPNSQQQHTDSNSLLTNAISNLAISFHKNLTNNKGENKQLTIIDDDNYDDNDFGIETSSLLNNSDTNISKAKIPASISVYDINKPAKLGELKTSATTTDINKLDTGSIAGESHTTILTTSSSSSTNSTANTPNSSTSFQKISSVWDDLLKKRSDLADEAAESLKKKLFNKVSLDNIKNKRANNSSQSSNNSSTVTTPVNIINKSINKSDSDLSFSTSIKEENVNSNNTNNSIIDTNNNNANSIINDNDLSIPITSNNNNNNNINNNTEKINSVNNDDKKIDNESKIKKDNNLNYSASENKIKHANNNKNDNNNSSSNNSNSFIIKYFFPILLSILVSFFYILPKNFSYFLLTYSFGLANGALIAILIFYLIIKLDFLKYILKDKKISAFIGSSSLTSNENTKDSELDDDKYNDKCTEYKIRNLLIQTCLTKENRNFDGIYRVSLLFFIIEKKIFYSLLFIFKGWMNELREVYDPANYFLNKTRSVYVNLDGNMLRLQTTTSRIPKRTVCGEMIPQVTFNEQRIYDLTDCEVFILPKELVRKRYWSKKYPICIRGAKLQNGKQFNQSMSSNSITNLDNNKSMNRNTSSLNISSGQSDSSALDDQLNISQQLDPGTLILFGRCDREKEEWFKLFKKSSKQQLMDSKQYLKLNRSSSSIKKRGSISSTTTTTTNDNTSIVCDTTNDRLVYKIVNNSDDDANSNETVTQLNVKMSESTSQENLSINANIKNMSTQTNQCLIYDTSLTVINTFLIRIFADFFNSKDYIKKIQTKIQNKLNTISVPYFMESLVITDLNLGNLIPLIRETSEPWHDERGLWVHLDIDYSGGIQMSLATKLNLMKLKSTSNKDSGLSPSSTNLNTVFSFKNNANNADSNIANDDEQCLSMFTNGLQAASDNTSINSDSSSINNDNSANNDKFKRKTVFTKNQKRHLGMTNSDEEDSAESSGDEYVHTGFNDDDNKLIET